MQRNSTFESNSTIGESSAYRFRARRAIISKRTTCSTIKVNDGDTYTSLASRCRIRGSAFATYNPKVDCSKLIRGQSVCCTLGDLPRPRPNADGTCATHLIENGDTCASLGLKYGLTVDEIESFNKGKTWAWTECKDILGGYNICLSTGTAPLPPPQQGTECGPLVPGTRPPTDPSVSTPVRSRHAAATGVSAARSRHTATYMPHPAAVREQGCRGSRAHVYPTTATRSSRVRASGIL